MKKPTSQPNRSTLTMVSFNFTKPQQQAIYRTLTALGLENADEWPTYFNAIEGVVRRALYKANRDMDESPLYVGEAQERLANLYAALNAAIQHYESMGGDLQMCLDRELLLDPLLSASLPASAQPTAVQVLSSGRLPLALKSLVEATTRCAVSVNHQNDLFPKTGATKKYVAFNRAVHELILIFREATGQRPTMYSTEHTATGYNGTFYPFAVAVLGPARLVPDKLLGSNILTAYKPFNDWLQGRKPSRKKKRKK